MSKKKHKKYNNKKIISFIVALVLVLSVFNFFIKRIVKTTMAKEKGNYLDEKSALVFLTDFGLKDGAVSAMEGVSFGVDPDLKLFTLTHDVPNYDVWEGAYRFKQTATYWPKGTVFVGVVDPGVGSDRKSIVLKTKEGYYFVGPDNGLFSLVAEDMGIQEVREIDLKKNRLEGSEKSYTFHGRDIFAYVGARLASGKVQFEEVGPKLKDKIVTIPYQKPTLEGDTIIGNIPVLDVEYGNIWSNIPSELFEKLNPEYGDGFRVEIFKGGTLIYDGHVPFVKSFDDVKEGQPLIYYNSLLNVSMAINMDSFAKVNGVGSGAEWTVKLTKIK